MKCYVLEEGKSLSLTNLNKEEINLNIEKIINEVSERWQVRNLYQRSGGSLYADVVTSDTEYERLRSENLVVMNNKVVGYYADHFNVKVLVSFNGNEDKVSLGDYDLTNYSDGGNNVDRGHVDMVHRPDNDTNPYADKCRFHSQEEYEDYIKWKD